MPEWKLFHGWMAFEHLDVDAGIASSYTIGYRFTDDSAEDWTNRFNRFKDKRQMAIRGGTNLMETAVPLLVKRLGLDASKTAFVPALSSSETVATGGSILAVMTGRCATVANTVVLLEAITKKPHVPLHSIYSADKRREILDDAEYKSGKIKAKNILIFDDFITRGDTLSHIALAILEANPGVAAVYGVGLAKTERRAYHKERFGVDISNEHIPERWETLWQEGEGKSHHKAK